MSKVKYPDKEKIRIQIDEILDKSELFDASEDKSSTYTNDKIVQLKPVKQHLPVGKYIGAVAAIAAIVVFVIAVKNYQTVVLLCFFYEAHYRAQGGMGHFS